VASRTAVAAAALALSDLDLFLKAVYLDPFVEVARATAGVYGPWLDGEKLVEEKQRLFKLYHVAEVISGAGPSRLLLYKKSENRGDYGGRPVDEALKEVLEGVEAGGGRVLEVFETVADLYGCTPI
jgi:homoserine kinase